MLLVFEAEPLVAEPPMVLPETLAEPLPALWELELETFTWLSLVIDKVLSLVLVIWLFDPGPVR